jgi:septal ring factor EnvC (AmiA/AmiB activator)
MQIHIHIHHHGHSNDEDVLHNIYTLTKSTHNKTTQIMADIQAFETALTRIDAATTNIANQLRELKDQLANQGLPADVENTVLARLESAASQLEAVGQSVENPVPPVEPPIEG